MLKKLDCLPKTEKLLASNTKGGVKKTQKTTTKGLVYITHKRGKGVMIRQT